VATPNTPDIRQYLTTAYGDEDLTILCADYFREVRDNFTAGMTKTRMIELLLDYCQRREVMPSLLAALERDRRDQYRGRFGQIVTEPHPVYKRWSGVHKKLWLLIVGGLVAVLAVVTVLRSCDKGDGEEPTPMSKSTRITTTVPIGLTEFRPSMIAEKDGIAMVFVPGGDFLMGAAEDDAYARIDEKPQHRVTLDAFWIDRIEITNVMFDQFVKETNYKTDAERVGESYVWHREGKQDWGKVFGANWRHPRGPKSSIDGLSDHPVSHVSWNDARSYCQWARRRLPTEAEWEKAARGPNGWLYPWGNIFECSFGNFTRLGCGGDIQIVTAPAASSLSGASFYGALNMAGNVQEWVADKYSADYYAESPNRNPAGPNEGNLYVLRGGSWRYDRDRVRTTARDYVGADHSGEDIGFRCAKSP